MTQEPVIASSETASPPSSSKNMAKQALGIGLGLLFLYLAFRDTKFSELWAEIQKLDPIWLIALSVVGLLSHVLRAARWNIMMQPLTEKRISLWNSFSALMIGYAVNVVIPRGGEVARVVSMSKYENLPWAGVLPTVFIDRLLDVAMLVLLLGTTLVALPPQMKAEMPGLVPAGGAMCLMTVLGFCLLPFAGAMMRRFIGRDFVKSRLPEHTLQKVGELSAQFDRGTKCLTSPMSVVLIAFLSVAIWACYFASLYLMFYAFHLQDKVDLSHALIVFAVGSVGVLIPAPGSIGAYHYFLSRSLTLLCGIDPTLALAYATVLHFFNFILLTCVPAAICFMVKSGSSKANQNKFP